MPEPRILGYTRWLGAERGLRFDATTYAGYDALWRWSVDDLDAFWRSIWDHFGVRSGTPFGRVLAERRMPGARWFEGATLNFAGHAFGQADAAHAAGHPALMFQDEALRAAGRLETVSWPELRRRVAALAAQWRALGIGKGDRVCAFLPNTPTAIVAFLATASVGAIWSVCSPDMGPLAVLDRFRQIAPKLLVACDGAQWAGVRHDRGEVLRQIVAGLPSLEHVVVDARLEPGRDPRTLLPGRLPVHRLDTLLAAPAPPVAPLAVPFDHPLWIVYSSGTTGLPKPIVHGHGGVLLEFLKSTLHNDIGPSAETGDRFHWFSTTGWVMWNLQVGALLSGTTVCIYDGAPSGAAGAPDWSVLWRFAADSGATFLGAGAAFFASCLKAGVEPTRVADLSRLRAIGSTGSPLSADVYRWIHEHGPRPGGAPIWIDSISGGTDFAGAFVGGLVTLPVIDGEMQCRWLGASVEAWNEQGRPVVDEVGELVCTQPMPSMPLYFWGDEGDRRYLESYFDMFPGVWRHGDWIRITPRGGAIIYGRSDATINRHGVRMGTAELYRAVEAEPEVLDSLVVDLEYLGRESWMPLFVVLRDGVVLDDALRARLTAAIRSALSPRHVPSEIVQVAAIPRTLTGKKMELPVKKLLLGAAPESVFKRDAMANAECIDWFAAYAARRAGASSGG